MSTTSVESREPGLTEPDTERQDESQLSKSLTLSRRRSPAISVPGLAILRCLGEGAYGAVWLAREKNTGKLVAVKVYLHRGGLDWSLLSREVEKLAVLYTSRNIVGLIGVGWDSDPPYYVMEYLERGSLAALLSSGPLSVSEAVRIAKGILHALVHAHGSGILHCDLKPANVLLDAHLQPRLCDFGQSRLSYEQDPALGTLFYMAPEQADLKAVPDARWDVYALGAVLHQMLWGQPPHRSAETEKRIEQAGSLEDRLTAYRDVVRDGARTFPQRVGRGIDRRLAEIVERCLQPDTEKRFPNAQAVMDALEQRDRARSFRPLLALGGLGPVLLMLALGLFYRDSMHDAVGSATANVTTRALESDVLSVEILARSVARELEKRMAELEEIAADPDICQGIELAAGRNWSDRSELRQTLIHWHSKANHLQQKLGLNRDRSWFLTDHHGIQRWREPEVERTLDQPFSFRDYFHGQGQEFEISSMPVNLLPITKPHLSLAYQSKVTDRNAISLSVPVWDEKHDRVIGVLGRSMEPGQLLSPFAPSKRRDAVAANGDNSERRQPLLNGQEVDRSTALIDGRNWRLLDHPWMTDGNLENVPPDKLRLSEAMAEQLRGISANAKPTESPVIQMDSYIDPVGQLDPQHFGGEWLAAFCPVGSTGWIAIVQERRSAALRPVDAMAFRLRTDGLWALAVSGVLIGTLWLVVLRSLHDRTERPVMSEPPNNPDSDRNDLS